MRKSFVMIVAVALVAALAVPAMAEVNFTGFYRAKGYISNMYLGTAGDAHVGYIDLGKDVNTNAYVDQRFRTKFTAGDENVKGVLFLESDIGWGSAAVGRGDLSADGKDLEIKNAYLWFKLPNTTVDVTLGVQGISDAYAGVFSGAADVAGVYANYKPAENFALKLGYAVPFIEDVATKKDGEVSLVQAEAKFAVNKDVKVGANLYYLRDGRSGATGSETKMYMPGVDFAANLGAANLTGFAFYQGGQLDEDYDISAYAADLRVDAMAGPAKVFGEVLYTSGDDGTDPDEFGGVVVLDDYDYRFGSSTFGRNATYLIMPAADSINTAAGLTYNANNAGYGLLLLQAGASMPLAEKLTGKFNAAWAQFNEAPGDDKDMGIEVNATAEYNLQKGLDVAATAAYLMIGDAYNGWSTPDNDDPYALVAKVNYAF